MVYGWAKILSAQSIAASGTYTTGIHWLGQNATLDSIAFKATGTGPDIKIEYIPYIGARGSESAGHVDDYTDVLASSNGSFPNAMTNANVAFMGGMALVPAHAYAFKITNLNAGQAVAVTIWVRSAGETA